MTILQHQLAALEREQAHLASLLEGNTYWAALQTLEQNSIETGAELSAVELRRQTLLAALSDNRVFQAHCRITESIKLLKGGRQPAHADGKADEKTATSDSEPDLRSDLEADADETSVLPDEAELVTEDANSQLDPAQEGVDEVDAPPLEEEACVEDAAANNASEEPDQKSIEDDPAGETLNSGDDAGKQSLREAESSKSISEQITLLSAFPAVSGAAVIAPSLSSTGSDNVQEQNTSEPEPTLTSDVEVEAEKPSLDSSKHTAKVSESTKSIPPKDVQPVLSIHMHPPEVDRQARSSAHSLEQPDDLTKIRGITREQAKKLVALGVTRFEEIASWTTADVRTIRAALSVGVALSQQNWIEQAALLALKRGPAQQSSASQIEQSPSPDVKAGDVPERDDETTKFSTASEGLTTSSAPEKLDAEDIPEGLLALKGMTPGVIAILENMAFTTLSQLATVSSGDVQRLKLKLGLDATWDGNWIEQAAILANGKPTKYLSRMRAGEFRSVVAPPVLQPVVDEELAQRLQDLLKHNQSKSILVEANEETASVAGQEAPSSLADVEISVPGLPANPLTSTTPVSQKVSDTEGSQDLAATLASHVANDAGATLDKTRRSATNSLSVRSDTTQGQKSGGNAKHNPPSVGVDEAEVIIIAQNSVGQETVGKETDAPETSPTKEGTDERDKSAPYAPHFLKPQQRGGDQKEISDPQARVLPGEESLTDHAYLADVQEASVEIIGSKDNLPHAEALPSVTSQDVTTEKTGFSETRPKTSLSRFLRALTGEK